MPVVPAALQGRCAVVEVVPAAGGLVPGAAVAPEVPGAEAAEPVVAAVVVVAAPVAAGELAADYS